MALSKLFIEMLKNLFVIYFYMDKIQLLWKNFPTSPFSKTTFQICSKQIYKYFAKALA